MAGKIVANTDEIFSMFCNICCETNIENLKRITKDDSVIKSALVLLVGNEDILNKAALFLCASCREVLTGIMKFKDMCLNNLIRMREVYFYTETCEETNNESLLDRINNKKQIDSDSVGLRKNLGEASRRSKRIAERKNSVAKVNEDKATVNDNCESKQKRKYEAREQTVTEKQLSLSLDEETIYISDDEDTRVTERKTCRVRDDRKYTEKTKIKKTENVKKVAANKNSASLSLAKAKSSKKSVYQCEICNKSFKQSTLFKNHCATHTGQRPYKCTWRNCKWNFSTKALLQRHYRLHTNTKPFKCLLCGAVFSRSDSMTSHVRRRHKEVHIM